MIFATIVAGLLAAGVAWLWSHAGRNQIEGTSWFDMPRPSNRSARRR